MNAKSLLASLLLIVVASVATMGLINQQANSPAVSLSPFPNDWSREPLYEAPRSSCWRKVSSEFKTENPQCAFRGCLGKEIEAHHVLTFREHPEKECDPSNLISLCRDGENHHLWVGHQGNFKESNPHVRTDCMKGEFPQRGWLRKQAHDAEEKRKSRDVFR